MRRLRAPLLCVAIAAADDRCCWLGYARSGLKGRGDPPAPCLRGQCFVSCLVSPKGVDVARPKYRGAVAGPAGRCACDEAISTAERKNWTARSADAYAGSRISVYSGAWLAPRAILPRPALWTGQRGRPLEVASYAASRGRAKTKRAARS